MFDAMNDSLVMDNNDDDKPPQKVNSARNIDDNKNSGDISMMSQLFLNLNYETEVKKKKPKVKSEIQNGDENFQVEYEET